MADEDLPSGAEEEILSGGEGFGRWSKKRSELERMAATYDQDQKEIAQSPYAIPDRLHYSSWAKRKLEESPPPRYSAIYGEDTGKGEPDYPTPYAKTGTTLDQGLQTPTAQAEPDYPQNDPKQGATGYPFAPPPVGDLQSDQGPPPIPIRVFAGGADVTQYPLEYRLAKDAQYQALGPKAKEKYKHLLMQADNVRASGWKQEEKEVALRHISNRISDLIDVHEEGKASGHAKAMTTIAGQQAQQAQQAQQQPIFSERQKQLIGKLQASQQEFQMQANSGEMNEDEIRKGVEYYQQAYDSIKPIGTAGTSFDPRFPPNQQRGMDWIDPKTQKHVTRDDKDNVIELKNERTLSTIGQLPAHEAHTLIEATKAANGLNDEDALALIEAREAKIRGETLSPEQTARLTRMPTGKSGVKPGGKPEAPMAEDKYHAAVDRVNKHSEELWEKDKAPADTVKGKPAGKNELGEFREDFIHSQLVQRGLAKDGAQPNRGNYHEYLDAWNSKQGAKQKPGQLGQNTANAEQVGAPAEQADPIRERSEFAAKLPTVIQKAQAGNDTTAVQGIDRLRQLTDQFKDKGILGMTPRQRGYWIDGMRQLRKYDTSVPEISKEDEKKLLALPGPKSTPGVHSWPTP